MSLGAMQFFGPYQNMLISDHHVHRENERTVRFDSFTWSALQVFLTALGEDWSFAMYTTMKKTGEGAALYFVFVAIWGKLILSPLEEPASDAFGRPPRERERERERDAEEARAQTSSFDGR